MRIALRRPGGRDDPPPRNPTGKPVLVIHMGMHKTGSTSVQDFFAEHRTELQRAGYVYPESGLYGNQHAALPASYMAAHPILPASYLEQDPSPILAELRRAVPPGYNAVLSSEVFWELYIYLRWHFEALHELLSQEWEVLLVYVAREAHDKAWSSVKHMAREGLAFDPVATYHEDIRLSRLTEDALLAQFEHVTRIEYDGVDSVRQVLSYLISEPVATLARTLPEESAPLRSLVDARRPGPGLKRGNRDFASPCSPAVTLCISETMNAGSQVDPELRARLPVLYSALFRRHRDTAAARGLPSNADLHDRIRRTTDPGAGVLTEADRQAVARFLRDERSRARRGRCPDIWQWALAMVEQEPGPSAA